MNEEEEEEADTASTRGRASSVAGHGWCARLQVYGVGHGVCVWVVVTDAGAEVYEGGLSRQTSIITHPCGLPRVTGQFGNPTAVTLSASL
jgi:hypothetical protein